MTFSQRNKIGFAVGLTILTVLGGLAYQANELRMASGQMIIVIASVLGIVFLSAAMIMTSYHLAKAERAEEALQSAERRFDAVVKHSADGILLVNATGKILLDTAASARILGTAPGELVGRSGFERMHPADVPRVLGLLARLIAHPSEPLTDQFRYRRADGSWRWIEATATNRLAEPSVGAVIVNYRDVSGRRAAEEASRASENRFRELFDNISSGVAVYEAVANGEDFIFKDFNPAAERIEEKSKQELIGRRVTEVFPGVREMGLLEVFRRVWRTGQPEHHPAVIYRDEQTEGWRENHVYKLPSGELVAVYDDVTARHQAEKALRESEERFRSLSASSPLGIFLADTEGQCIYANPRFRALFNHSLRETIGKGWLRSVLEDDRASVEEAWQTAMRQTRDFSHEFRLRSPNGPPRWVHLRASPMVSDSKELLGHVGTIEDITDRRAVEQQLRLQAGALEAAANGIVITDRNGVIIWVNTAFSRLTGYTVQEAVGQTLRLIKSGRQEAAFYSEMWETILAGRVWHGQIVNRRKDGAFYTEEMTITPVRDSGGAISHFIAIKQDVSERQQLEEQFRQSQKMEAVGRLAGGVAHDFNNLLMAILGYSDIILGEPELSGTIRESAEEVKAAAERAASLTRQLLAFSRRQMLAPQIVNLNDTVTGIEKMLRRLIGEDIALIIRLKEPLRSVKADPNQIEQVIMNLAINARDAMPRGGKLVLETTEVEFDKRCGRHNLEIKPGAYVVLIISDTGSGMPADVQAHLFEPFFTTKQQGKGTGLGLATVYGIVKQSGGDIGVYSEVGFGTTFKVYLPVAKTGKAEPNGLKAKPDSQRGTETILLVEDDEGVRKLVRETLKHLGYTVLEAKDGAEAIERFGREPEQVHLMITDVVMPGLGGCASVQLMKPLRPDMKVLYMSGYTQETILQHGLTSQRIPVLQKPFSADTLGREVRDLLDAPAGPP